MQVNRRILILCEDEKSSLLYFKGFKKDPELKRKLAALTVDVYHPDDFSPLGLVNEAKARIKLAKRDRNPYDEVWIAFDKDGHSNIPQAFNDAKQANINIAFSNICFEYWILLHFEYTTKGFRKSDELIKYIQSKHFKNYDKCKGCFQELKDKMQIAIKNGEKLIKNLEPDLLNGTKEYDLSAYTDVYKLVKTIIKTNS